MQTFKKHISIIAKVSLVLILLGFFGKKNKSDKKTSEKDSSRVEYVKTIS
ncbi:MAG: hypothetical protein ACJAWV_001845 [Flammeovirgaceae bacterium]|jgi:hypothetical protein